MSVPSSVSVIIINFNAGKYIERTLQKLSEQTHKPENIIIYDNASSDGSCEAIQQQWPKVQLIRLSTNLGFAAANNLAIKSATDVEWVALLNPDAFPTETWLEQLLSAAERHPECHCFGSRVHLANETEKLDGTGDMYHVSGLAWRRGHGQLAEGREGQEEEIFSVCAAAVLYKRETFLKVGGFDERYFTCFEDMDLGFRLKLMGYRSLYVPNAVVDHVGSAITGIRSDFSIYHGHRNLVWTYFKNMPGLLFWLYLPQHLLLNLVTIIWFSLRGQAKVIFRAKWDALQKLPQVWKDRQRVQSKRQISIWALRRVMVTGFQIPHLRRAGEKLNVHWN